MFFIFNWYKQSSHFSIVLSKDLGIVEPWNNRIYIYSKWCIRLYTTMHRKELKTIYFTSYVHSVDNSVHIEVGDELRENVYIQKKITNIKTEISSLVCTTRFWNILQNWNIWTKEKVKWNRNRNNIPPLTNISTNTAEYVIVFIHEVSKTDHLKEEELSCVICLWTIEEENMICLY